jgi:hypothetical protein
VYLARNPELEKLRSTGLQRALRQAEVSSEVPRAAPTVYGVQVLQIRTLILKISRQCLLPRLLPSASRMH